MIPIPGFGFQRSHRLLNQAQFGRVLNGRCRAGNEYFTVYALANRIEHPRLGLIVGKKAARRAVDRNRIKRIIREVFRKRSSGFSKMDLVVLAKAAATEQPGTLLDNQLSTLLDRVEKKCANFSLD